jgi:hypothetical protein
MHETTGLNDRIHLRMLVSERPWTAETMGQEFLKLRGGSAVALVRALLRADARFVEEAPGIWTARRAAAVPLRARSFAVAWVETGDRSRPDTWRVHLRPTGDTGEGSVAARTEVLHPADPARWDTAFRALGKRRIATLQPGPLGRVRQWMGRHWALGGDEEPVLDLHALARLAVIRDGVSPAESAAAARLPRLFAHLGLGPVREEPEGVPLPALELLLDHLLELFGDAAEEDLARTVEKTLSPRAVPADRFDFTLRDLESVPEGSGIYRFIGDGGALLYIGKAISLRRRLASYFRPLPPEPTKREELLGAIRRFEVTPLPSELEALLRESRAIREHRPPWNVQVEVHELDTLPPGWWWPLIFLAPGTDPRLVSVFLINGPADGFLFHVPRAAEASSDVTLAAWLDGVIAAGEPPEGGTSSVDAPAEVDVVRDVPTPGRARGSVSTREALAAEVSTPSTAASARPSPDEAGCGLPDGEQARREAALRAGVVVLGAAEVRLAVRFFLRERDRLDRVDAIDLTDGQALAETLHRLAAAPPGAA